MVRDSSIYKSSVRTLGAKLKKGREGHGKLTGSYRDLSAENLSIGNKSGSSHTLDLARKRRKGAKKRVQKRPRKRLRTHAQPKAISGNGLIGGSKDAALTQTKVKRVRNANQHKQVGSTRHVPCYPFANMLTLL